MLRCAAIAAVKWSLAEMSRSEELDNSQAPANKLNTICRTMGHVLELLHSEVFARLLDRGPQPSDIDDLVEDV